MALGVCPALFTGQLPLVHLSQLVSMVWWCPLKLRVPELPLQMGSHSLSHHWRHKLVMVLQRSARGSPRFFQVSSFFFISLDLLISALGFLWQIGNFRLFYLSFSLMLVFVQPFFDLVSLTHDSFYLLNVDTVNLCSGSAVFCN